MDKYLDFKQVQDALSAAQDIFVVFPQKLSLDKIAAGLSLSLSLAKIGKKTNCFCSWPMTVEYSSLVGVDKIARELGGKNLTVSFDYIEDSIEKVSYNIENNRFNLVIQPKEGHPPLSSEKVVYSYSGNQADLIFVIGALSLEELGDMYEKNRDLFDKGNTINIDINTDSSKYAKVNLVDGEAASYSELIANLINRLKLPANEDIAGNLLKGIEEATDIFSSPNVGAGTFEAAAFCLRAGARRKTKVKVDLKPMPEEISAEKPPKKEDKPSADWLEPKIYKGTTLV